MDDHNQFYRRLHKLEDPVVRAFLSETSIGRAFRLFKWKDDIQSKKLHTDFGTKRAIKLKRMKGDLQLYSDSYRLHRDIREFPHLQGLVCDFIAI